VNKLPPEYDMDDVRSKVENAYNCDVAALLPLSFDIAKNASAAVFCDHYPDHAFTRGVKEVVRQLEEEMEAVIA
jgi:MinD-like ATPase involved in chromosome partitioning or flagellar assembly